MEDPLAAGHLELPSHLLTGHRGGLFWRGTRGLKQSPLASTCGSPAAMDERLRKIVVDGDATAVLDKLFELYRDAAVDHRKITALRETMDEVKILLAAARSLHPERPAVDTSNPGVASPRLCDPGICGRCYQKPRRSLDGKGRCDEAHRDRRSNPMHRPPSHARTNPARHFSPGFRLLCRHIRSRSGRWAFSRMQSPRSSCRIRSQPSWNKKSRAWVSLISHIV